MSKKPTGMQVTVYDLGSNPLPTEAIEEVEKAVVNVLKRLKNQDSSKYSTLAHLVVTE